MINCAYCNHAAAGIVEFFYHDTGGMFLSYACDKCGDDHSDPGRPYNEDDRPEAQYIHLSNEQLQKVYNLAGPKGYHPDSALLRIGINVFSYPRIFELEEEIKS